MDRRKHRRALITGIGGQDGSYLAEHLLAEGTTVVGLVRPGGSVPHPAIAGRVELVEGDLSDPASLRAAVTAAAPDELYHLAAPTFVPDSWKDPTAIMETIAAGTAALLAAAAARESTRVFVASSPEIFGDAGESPQHEGSPTRPRSPYGVAKLAAHGLVGTLRSQGLWAVSGITYNHESPRRPQRFVTRKITRGAAAIALGLEEELVLGDLSAIRDWSHARDVMSGAVLALRAPEPADYVFASGVGRTVGDLVEAAFAHADVSSDGRVRTDPAFVRPPEPVPLIGDPSRARAVLGWEPATSFEELVAEMVDADLAELREP